MPFGRKDLSIDLSKDVLKNIIADPLVSPRFFFLREFFSRALGYLNALSLKIFYLLISENIFFFFFLNLHAKESRRMKGSPRIQSHGLIQDSRFWFSDSFHQWNLISRIPVVSGIPDSSRCIPDSKSQDSTFNKQKFSQNPYILSWEGGFHEKHLMLGNLC